LVHSLLTKLGIKRGILAWSLYIVNPISIYLMCILQ
jgi:hypothetical protein